MNGCEDPKYQGLGATKRYIFKGIDLEEIDSKINLDFDKRYLILGNQENLDADARGKLDKLLEAKEAINTAFFEIARSRQSTSISLTPVLRDLADGDMKRRTQLRLTSASQPLISSLPEARTGISLTGTMCFGHQSEESPSSSSL